MNYQNHNKIIYSIYIIIITSFFLGFFLNEDSTGGAFLDYQNQKELTKSFATDLYYTFDNYEKFGTRHSPVLPFLLSFLEKYNVDQFNIKLIYLIINLPLLIFFYKILKLKKLSKSTTAYFFLTSLILLSPTFRSLINYPDSRLLGLTFFCASIYYYLKFEEKKKFKFAINNILLLSISSYISPNFSVFSLFFFIKFFQVYKISYKVLCIILLNICLAIPAIFYVIIEQHNFLFSNKAIESDINNLNYFNKILIITSIFLFYLIPFVFTKLIKIDLKCYKKIFFSILIVAVCASFFDYPSNFSGGGIFFKFSNLIIGNNLIFYFFSILGIYLILQLAKNNIDNFVIFILLILNNPQLSIYHKYYDPLILILLFSILKFNLNLEILSKTKNKIFIFFYFALFLTINLLKKI